DGSAKFVRGDAIAGLLITGLNIVGGIFIGMAQRGMSIGEALSRYTILTVGDRLVSQLTALIISTAAGIMVTHSASECGGPGRASSGELAGQSKAMWVSSGVVASLGLVPGLPALPFLALAGTLALVAQAASRREEAAAVALAPAAPAALEPAPK